MLPDIACPDGAKQRIRDGVRQNICVRVTFQPARVRDLDAAQNQRSSFSKPVHIIADAGSNHGFTPLRRVKMLNRLNVELGIRCNDATM